MNTSTDVLQPQCLISHARARLLLGIVSVGSIVCACVISLVGFSLTNHEFRADAGIILDAPLTSVLLMYFFYLCLQAPADISGGVVIPLAFRKRKEALLDLILSLGSGIVRHGILHLATLAILFSGRLTFGRPGLLIASAVNVALLLLFQTSVLKFVGGITIRKTEDKDGEEKDAEYKDAVVAVGLDSGFTGGVVDSLRGPVSLLPPTNSEGEISYKALRLTAIKKLQPPFARLVVPIATNSIGAILTLSYLSNYSPSPVRDVIIYSLCSTIWSFFCLLVLPYLNRQAVLTLDVYLVKAGLDIAEFERSVRSEDLRGEDEYSRSRLVQSVFYPIPDPETRVKNVVNTKNPKLFWMTFHQVARRTLYSSLGFGGFLSRSVHCNAGRPELWIVSPSD